MIQGANLGTCTYIGMVETYTSAMPAQLHSNTVIQALALVNKCCVLAHAGLNARKQV